MKTAQEILEYCISKIISNQINYKTKDVGVREAKLTHKIFNELIEFIEQKGEHKKIPELKLDFNQVEWEESDEQYPNEVYGSIPSYD